MDDKDKLIKELYQLAKILDSAYLQAVAHNGESSFTGEEYEKLTDTFIKAEKFLGIE